MFSIIIPTYNRVASLKKCIDSILIQEENDLEIIIIDDCSNDNTFEYLSSLANNTHITVISNEKNHGVNYSRNRGIEAAKKKYIIFIDSDDEMLIGSIYNIKKIIYEYITISHFLFLMTIRAEEFKYVVKNTFISYEQWINGSIKGDFTHVISTLIMKKYLFHEEFRMFEKLNWFRVLRESSPQLLVPLVATKIEINRIDSLIRNSKLQSISVIKDKFQSELLFYKLYYDDLRLYNAKSLEVNLIKAMLLGIACNRKKESLFLLRFVKSNYLKILANLLFLIPPSIIKYFIIIFSKFKNANL